MIYKEFAKVISNKMIAENIYEAYLFSPNISKKCKPGQFINILPSSNWGNVMRRPMSIASQDKDVISIIYKIFGEGTKLISQWEENEEVNVIGPLGNFWTNYDKRKPVLVGGGVGIAPIFYLHDKLNELNLDHILVVGAKYDSEHFIEHNPDRGIYLSTDNGNIGIEGNVIDVLKKYKIVNNLYKIFACGPHGMIKGIQNYALGNNIECDLALETIMACGIGICQGCTIIKKSKIKEDHSYRQKYALACEDGPIFNIKDLENDFC